MFSHTALRKTPLSLGPSNASRLICPTRRSHFATLWRVTPADPPSQIQLGSAQSLNLSAGPHVTYACFPHLRCRESPPPPPSVVSSSRSWVCIFRCTLGASRYNDPVFRSLFLFLHSPLSSRLCPPASPDFLSLLSLTSEFCFPQELHSVLTLLHVSLPS